MDSTSVDRAGDASFFGRNEFLIRRLHSLSGLVPVGAYMCVHLLTNAAVLDGPRSFQTRVDQIHSLGSALPLIEWAFIFLPILFHAVVGVWIVREAQFNTTQYVHASNVRYMLQRATAWIAFFFIAYHVFHMHGWIKPLAREVGGANFDPHHATSSAATALSSLPVQLFYLVGVVACVYHLANGIWTAGITWGLWTSPAAQRRASLACGAFGVLLALVGLGALGGMLRVDIEGAKKFEARHEAARKLEEQIDEADVAPSAEAPATAQRATPVSSAGH